MKTTILLFFGALLFVACQQAGPDRYTQDAPEIDIYKSGLAAYEAQEWDKLRSFYADTAKIYFNALPDNAQSVEDAIAEDKEMAEMFSEYGLDPDASEFERVITDEGETWVNYWGVWQGVVAATGNRVEVPVHLTARFVDSLVVQEHGYWDNLPFYLAMQAAEAEAEAAAEVMEEEIMEETGN